MGRHGKLRQNRPQAGLLEGLADELSTARGNIGRVFEQYFAAAPAAGLGAADFEHQAADWRCVETLLRDGLANERCGVNVLLYGAPGVGKMELVRAMGAALEASVFEIVNEREDQQTDRLRAYCLAQETLKRRGGCLVLFDEVEDVFPVTAHSLFGMMRVSGRNKAWTNQLLESNPVPAVWLTNTVQPIDPAFLRRFDYVAEMSPPPTPVRERLVREQLKGLDVEAGWVRRMAARERLVPSQIERAGRLARLAANEGTAPERVFERAVENTQRAMGLPWQPSPGIEEAERFDFGFVNSDVDLEGITRGLQRGRAGRIALYGPPGTGKSLFARHLAAQLALPLVRKRASDLLSRRSMGSDSIEISSNSRSPDQSSLTPLIH
ncbi:MAG: ATP-binding protein [Gammaproteobacteria bacterium]|nr:ATP-binding protein [Gammaproteobacteria bacterium]